MAAAADDAPPSMEVEGRYWESFNTAIAEEDQRLLDRFIEETKDLRNELASMQRDKARAEENLRQINLAYHNYEERLETRRREFELQQRALAAERAVRRAKMTAWFGSRGTSSHPNPSSDEHVDVALGDITNGIAVSTRRIKDGRTSLPDGPQAAAANGAAPRYHHTFAAANNVGATNDIGQLDDLTGVEVFDGDGNFVAPVRSIPAQNAVVSLLLGLPVKRRVNTRPGRTFDLDKFNSIYDKRYTYANGPNAKPARWTAVMLQATGDVLEGAKRCLNCTKNLGPFDTCIIPRGPNFRKCGNCEWSKQPCQMPAEEAVSDEDDDEARSTPKTGVQEDVTQYTAAAPQDDLDDSRDDSPAPNALRKRPKGITTIQQQQQHQNVYHWQGDKTPKQTSPEDDSTEEDMEPITASNLVLRHDGVVYTHPECMQGVPLVKIDPSHPYWEPDWEPDLENAAIQPALESWRVKHEAALKGNTSSKFQVGRQVNRGETILKFLRQADISPYQLLSKKYVNSRLVGYDTLFRLADTFFVLESFGTMDITPLEWIRHRLHEVIQEEGPHFKLYAKVHNFYHDRKLEALRLANGKRSIGRPSGMKMSGKKRKSLNDTPIKAIVPPVGAGPTLVGPLPGYDVVAQVSAAAMHHAQNLSAESEQERPYKRKRKPLVNSRNGTPLNGEDEGEGEGEGDYDLQYDGYTDTDDYSGDQISNHDFCLSSVKSRINTTSTSVTQYWHWVDIEGGTDDVFEHQVLSDCNPPSWGLYSNPVNFHFTPQDVVDIQWAADTRKVVVRCRPGVEKDEQTGQERGDMIADFARERTKRRFLVFCEKRGIKIVKTTSDAIEQAWETTKSPFVDPVEASELEMV
ncbi:hypothetical protein VD0002_g3187 [Verticillium dahliae]|uniref:Uncharacterized protein n=2 Tax=Verticillium dahliae TaxID=27337 RepID=G2XI34_VERDV|nr:uncharacterized protein VDAG_09684 [Verticillium dahliae VdLs.17]KAF3351786.1 Inositol phosphorylceramide synthase [Verticillium dahliae VDG2]KAF3353346.1 hypothetical protein VdG1_08397 [Verticillium dahliae VDG1]KAH6708703.1 hypothetical protein EV126DRAFT_511684 [Verticillium dahliae]EGY19482.1 hypothetical protein VDAG_09684 [Verticillium dahliae VdLs.17]PNH29298.1 hypothetical protein BJF96_g7411 [Verticillium dahliae]